MRHIAYSCNDHFFWAHGKHLGKDLETLLNWLFRLIVWFFLYWELETFRCSSLNFWGSLRLSIMVTTKIIFYCFNILNTIIFLIRGRFRVFLRLSWLMIIFLLWSLNIIPNCKLIIQIFIVVTSPFPLIFFARMFLKLFAMLILGVLFWLFDVL